MTLYLLGKYPHIVINMFSIKVARSVSFRTACPLANRHHLSWGIAWSGRHPSMPWAQHLVFAFNIPLAHNSCILIDWRYHYYKHSIKGSICQYFLYQYCHKKQHPTTRQRCANSTLQGMHKIWPAALQEPKFDYWYKNNPQLANRRVQKPLENAQIISRVDNNQIM